MTIAWSDVTAQAAACGLLGIVIVAVIRAATKKKPLITLHNALSVFLGFALIPSIPVLLTYPFIEPKPDLSEHALFICLAALALAWAVGESFRQGLK